VMLALAEPQQQTFHRGPCLGTNDQQGAGREASRKMSQWLKSGLSSTLGAAKSIASKSSEYATSTASYVAPYVAKVRREFFRGLCRCRDATPPCIGGVQTVSAVPGAVTGASKVASKYIGREDVRRPSRSIRTVERAARLQASCSDSTPAEAGSPKKSESPLNKKIEEIRVPTGVHNAYNIRPECNTLPASNSHRFGSESLPLRTQTNARLVAGLG
jgi:hypothetical protein